MKVHEIECWGKFPGIKQYSPSLGEMWTYLRNASSWIDCIYE